MQEPTLKNKTQWIQQNPIFLTVTHILHELAADRADVLAERCTEHHHLLFMGCHAENFLDISSHI